MSLPSIEEDPSEDWYSLLQQNQGAAISTVAPSARRLVVEWPLRLAAFPQSTAAEVVGRATQQWPCNRLTRAVTIDRFEQESDILVHVGTIPDLLTRARDLPFGIKTGLILVAHGDTSARANADDVMRVFGASGMALTDSAEEQVVSAQLNGIVNNLSHNAPFDHAICTAVGPFAFGYFTEGYANLQLSQIARQINTRLTRLPRNTTIDLGSVRTEILRTPPVTRSAEPPKTRAAENLEIDFSSLRWDHESDSASDLAAISMAINEATEPSQPGAARYLQQQSFIKREGELIPASHGFLVGVPAQVNVRIGPSGAGWQSIATPFDDSSLPRDEDEWELDVWLLEPDQIARPLRQPLTLARSGASSTARFEFSPLKPGSFDARITVVHRGRVLQTATLQAVVSTGEPQVAQGAPVLSEPLCVRQHLDGLDQRRQFDLAVVLNHTEEGKPRATSIAGDAAGVRNLDKALKIAEQINIVMSRLGDSVADYKNGIRSEEGRLLLRDVARQGSALAFNLFNSDVDKKNNGLRHCEFIHVVNTESDSLIPFELIYDRPFPDDDAKVCEGWKACLANGACELPGDTRTICPMGFWGLSKVIERHASSPQLASSGNRLYLQSAPRRGRDQIRISGPALVANSQRVSAPLTSLIGELEKRTGACPQRASDWTEWKNKVSSSDPGVIIAMPHSQGTGDLLALEIGGVPIYALQLLPQHVRANPSRHPLIALLGCDTGNLANDYLSHVAVFQDRGAAIVIGTIATVFGDDAPRVAEQLICTMLPAASSATITIGEAMRSLRREALLNDFLLPLCIVAFGDADWELVH